MLPEVIVEVYSDNGGVAQFRQSLAGGLSLIFA